MYRHTVTSLPSVSIRLPLLSALKVNIIKHATNFVHNLHAFVPNLSLKQYNSHTSKISKFVKILGLSKILFLVLSAHPTTNKPKITALTNYSPVPQLKAYTTITPQSSPTRIAQCLQQLVKCQQNRMSCNGLNLQNLHIRLKLISALANIYKRYSPR